MSIPSARSASSSPTAKAIPGQEEVNVVRVQVDAPRLLDLRLLGQRRCERGADLVGGALEQDVGEEVEGAQLVRAGVAQAGIDRAVDAIQRISKPLDADDVAIRIVWLPTSPATVRSPSSVRLQRAEVDPPLQIVDLELRSRP